MEFVHYCLGGSFFCFGVGALTCKMTPICKLALPTNHPFCRMSGPLLQAASHNISSSHSFFRMGGDALGSNWSETTLNYWMMVERYLNLKEEIDSAIPGCEISSLLDRGLVRWSTGLMCLGAGMSAFSFDK